MRWSVSSAHALAGSARAGIIVAVLLAFAPAWAQEAGDSLVQLPAFDLTASDSGPLRVGDSIELKLNAFPEGAVRLGPPGEGKSLTEAGWAARFSEGALSVKVVALKPGNLILPSLMVLDADGKPIGRTHPWNGEIQSAIAPDDPAPAQAEEAPPPQSLPFPWQYLVLGVLVAVLIAGGAVYGLLRWSRSRSGRIPAIPAEAEKPEDVRALEALSSVERTAWMRAGEYKRHYFAVSEILKAYIGARYSFDAPEMTTRELITHLESTGLSARILDQIEAVYERLDRVKFTDHVPDEEAGAAVLQDARKLVESTRRRTVARAS